MSDTAIKIENLKKQYRLGAIGGGTLRGDLQSWWARKRGKEDPNLKIGQDYNTDGDTFWALKGIDLEVKKGEALGIIGANGAGKSTLLKILSRVTAPNEGDIWINGRIASMLEVGTGFHGELTGRENIYMNGAILGMSKKEVDSKIESIIDFSECRQFIDTPVKRYSSGMYVKLAFAVASHLDAEIMVMDEVLAVGDMAFQKKCLGKMGDEAKGGRTVLYVSHNMATIRNLCSRCIVLDRGLIIYDGDVDSAISEYINSKKSELKTFIDSTLFKRYTTDLARKVFIRDVTMIDKLCPQYTCNELIRMRVRWRAIEDINNVKLGFLLEYIDGTVIGFASMEGLISAKAESTHDDVFEIDLRNLAAGIYIISLNMFEIGKGRDLHSLDQPDKIVIEIVDSGNEDLMWQRRYWGSVRINAMRRVIETYD